MKTTLEEMNKEYGNGKLFKGNSRMKLTTWLKRKGFSSLAKVLEIVEKKSKQH